MIELTYEQRMALFDVIAELKTGIVCEECGNNIWPSDLCLTPQLEQLQTILDNATVISVLPKFTISYNFDGMKFNSLRTLPIPVGVTSKIAQIDVSSLKEDPETGGLSRVYGEGVLEIYLHDSIDGDITYMIEVINHRDAACTEKMVSIPVKMNQYLTLYMHSMSKHMFRANITLEGVV